MTSAPFQKSGLTHAQQLLSLVFQGHEIRTILQNGTPFFVAKDVATACGLSKYRDAIANHLDADEIHLMSILSGQQTRQVMVLTEAGIVALVMASRKPAARQFRRWLLSEVLPQLLKYGTYAPGATAGERCHALHLRWKQERAQELGIHAAALDQSGLLTIAAFRRMEPCPGEDALLLSHHLRTLAREAGFEPERFYLGTRRHTPAWPRPLLEAARRRANPTHALRLS
jgi:prophage antirepressor-like protein